MKAVTAVISGSRLTKFIKIFLVFSGVWWMNLDLWASISWVNQWLGVVLLVSTPHLWCMVLKPNGEGWVWEVRLRRIK